MTTLPALEPYQREGSLFLQLNKRAILADDMGLGKTPQAIDAARDLERVLVVCPAVAKYNWQKEFIKFDNRKSVVAERGVNYRYAKTVITSYEYLVANLHFFTQKRWDTFIVDEVHFTKEPTSLRAKACFGKEGVLHKSDRTWTLSGTPAPNHAGELWILLFTFGLTKLSYQGFIARYCKSHHTDGYYSRVQITGTNTEFSDELREMLKRCSLRRLKKDLLDLPPVTHNEFYIKGDSDGNIFKNHPELKVRVRQELEVLKERLGIEELDTKDEKVLSTLEMLGQSISSLRRYHGFKKIKETAQLIRGELEIGLYKKVIVFGIHTDVINTLQKELSEFQNAKITGEVTSAKVRDHEVFRFQNDPECKIFYGNIKAAGTAITLTATTQVIFIEVDWVPGNNDQAVDRANRYGQISGVNARYITIKDSIDEKIMGAVARKAREISTFIC